ncbi:MAG TPA: hypothetical protein VIC71_02455 [Gammaproteobacteria bacterium]|jgi:hypothetical protein
MSKIHPALGCLGLLLAANASAEIRTYDVDFKYQQEVYGALVHLLNVDPGISAPAGLAYGRLQLLPTGQIVVDTAPETHAQIEELLAAIRERQTDATPRVTFRYWAVLGTSADNQPGNPPPPILNEVLAELRRVHGDLAFRVLGTASLVTESGQEGEVASEPLGAKQRVYVQEQTASAVIELNYVERTVPTRIEPNPRAFTTFSPYEGKIALNVSLERGEFLVLGESTVRNQQLNGTLFYIVHWPAEQ